MAWPDDLDYSDDFKVFNNRETVQYISKSTEKPTPLGETVTDTLWLMIRKDNLEVDSILLDMDVTVTVPGKTFAAAFDSDTFPKANDIMVRSDDTRWTVKLVEHPAGTDWRCHCIRSRAVNG